MAEKEVSRSGETEEQSGRLEQLREQLLAARPEVFAERALLVTRAYLKAENDSPEIRRAKALEEILLHSQVTIRPQELIVGAKTLVPKGSPLYPEFNVHWLEEELEGLPSRAETPFDVSPQTQKIIEEEVIPAWQGRTVFDRILETAPRASLAAAEEGLFFHYYIDRSIGHLTVNYEKVLKLGIRGLKSQIEAAQAGLSPDQADYRRQEDFYRALTKVADAAVAFAHRYAELAEEMALSCDRPDRRRELETIAGICRRVPEYPAAGLHEALQSFWFIHLILNLESNSYAISPGRFCQYIHPYYQADVAEGRLDENQAQELINCLWIKFNELTVVKAGASAKASNTYVDFQNLNIGGQTLEGHDGVNDISFFCLNALEELALPQPQLSCLISSKTDQEFLLRACEVVRQGNGMPTMFNDDVKVISLLANGKSLEDARRGGINGCVEINAQGCDNMASTGYVNFAKCLELALNNGRSMTSGRKLGPETGPVEEFQSFDDLWQAFAAQLKAAVSLKISYDEAARKVFAEHCPVVFTSLVMDDCITKGRDFHQGGARYNAPMMCGVGLGTLSDSLAAIKDFCFIRGRYSLRELVEALKSNFSSHELLQKQLWLNAPKLGNNIDLVDQLASDTVDLFCDVLAGHQSMFGEAYGANLIPTTTHLPMGAATAATPDGRLAGAPLSEGISPVQGQDVNGPTSVLLSLAKLNHARTVGTLLNMKFTPATLAGESQLTKFSQLIRTYFAMGGYQLQFNVVSEETLRAAQKDPQAYRSLIVRVAGYSDYFISLSKDLQDEIITRTAHGVV